MICYSSDGLAGPAVLTASTLSDFPQSPVGRQPAAGAGSRSGPSNDDSPSVNSPVENYLPRVELNFTRIYHECEVLIHVDKSVPSVSLASQVSTN